MHEQDLVELFRKLGARNPAAWARSQSMEGLPQLARFLFLRQAWRLVIREDDRSWIVDGTNTNPSVPGGSIGPALKRVLASGATEEDLTSVVRVMQWRVLAGICHLLSDTGDLEDEVKDIAWGLFQVDDLEQPLVAMSGMHESVLETDPTGRDMRPR